MAASEDLYEILQVHPSAHPEVIQAAYRRLAMLYHPDQNSSDEATHMMARINQAFDVLNDPDRRAEYDRGGEPPGTPPRTSAPAAGTAGNAQRHRQRSGTSSPGYITIGSRKEDVARIQGPPDSTHPDSMDTRKETWSYDDVGVFFFGTSGRVEAWSSHEGRLKVGMTQGPNATKSESFTTGSHKDDVVRLQGTPYRVDIDEEFEFKSDIGLEGRYIKISERWYYHEGVIEFDISTGRVRGWQNTGGSLKVPASRRKQPDRRPAPVKPELGVESSTLDPPDSDIPKFQSQAESFSLGSSKLDVRKVQGPPDKVDRKIRLDQERWTYNGAGEITFYKGMVRGWSNPGGALKVHAPRNPGKIAVGVFSLDSTREVVAAAQGTPWSIVVDPAEDVETWSYSGSIIEFSFSSGRVIFWEDNERHLKVGGVLSAITREHAEAIRQQTVQKKQALHDRLSAIGRTLLVVAAVLWLLVFAAVCVG